MFFTYPGADGCLRLWYNFFWSWSQHGGFSFADIVVEEWGENIPVAAHLFPA